MAVIPLLMGCGEPPESKLPASQAANASLIAESAIAEPPPSRTLAIRYETTRIGAPRDRETTAARWTGRPIDLDVKDADIRDVLRLLSDVGHANLVVADGVSGRVTIRMKHVPWDQALDVVARAKGLAIERDDGVTLVTPARP
jgi:type II secretory pathway component HofQ